MTRKVGDLTPTSSASGAETGFNFYGATSAYNSGPITLATGYDFACGWDTWFSDFKYTDIENRLFAKARVEKDMFDNKLVVATFGKGLSDNQWFQVGVGLVDFADSRPDLRTAMAGYSLKTPYFILQRVTASCGCSNGA